MDKAELIRASSSHTDKEICGFFGDYFYLSNFQPCSLVVWGKRFPSSEHAYMWAKLPAEFWTKELHTEILKLKPSGVKSWGQTIKLRSDWEEVKRIKMLEAVAAKFSQNPDLKEKLKATGDKYLEERLWWNDFYWGVDYKTKSGENWLGKILMSVREFL